MSGRFEDAVQRAVVMSMCNAAEAEPHKELLEVSKTVMICKDELGDACIVVMPQLGLTALSPKRFGLTEKEIIEKIYKHFVNKTRPYISGNVQYSMVYVHPAEMGAVGHRSKVLSGRKLLPKEYRKNLRLLRIVHPNLGLNSLMTSLRLALSSKFFTKKVSYFADFLSMQNDMGAAGGDLVELPVDVQEVDDSMCNVVYSGRMPGLEAAFVETLGQPEILWRCANYIRAYGMTTNGLFRVPGHNKLRQMALSRAQDKDVGNEKIIFAPPSGEAMHGVDHMSIPGHMSVQSMDSMDLGALRGKAGTMSTMVIRDPLVAAGLYKQCLRDLPEPVITFQAFALLMQLPLVGAGQTDETLLGAVNLILDRMPTPNRRTFAEAISLMAEAALNKDGTNVKLTELCSIFAPTLMRKHCVSNGEEGDDAAITSALVDINRSKKVLELKLNERIARGGRGIAGVAGVAVVSRLSCERAGSADPAPAHVAPAPSPAHVEAEAEKEPTVFTDMEEIVQALDRRGDAAGGGGGAQV